MDDGVEQTHPPYPLMRIFTFGEFSLERLVPSSTASAHAPRYIRLAWEEWDNRKPAMTLLKVLLCRTQRRATRQELIEIIWPGQKKINATHALDSAASILRRRILYTHTGESLLHTIRDAGETSFKLAPQQRLWVDADAFLALATQAIRVESLGQNSLPLLEAAHALAVGRFLEDDQQHQWSQGRRLTLNGARHRVLYKLVDLYLQAKRVSMAEELLFTFLEENPTDEDALCRLLKLLLASERWQEALSIYQYTADVLHEENREPSSRTQELVQRIQRGQLVVREQQANYTATDTVITLPVLSATYMHAKRRCFMHVEVDKMRYGTYQFSVELDTGSETGANQLTVYVAEPVSGEWTYLRDFYFDETNSNHIRNFCRKFATDEIYRKEVLARETRWAKRNALFVRNLDSIVGEDTRLWLSNAHRYGQKAREFFHWINIHVETILALPEYQHLQAIDSAILSDPREVDPLIQPAIELLNSIPGVVTQFSCQGVTGKVRFQEQDLLAVSAHEEYAYVSFAELGQSAYDTIMKLLPEFPSITNTRIPNDFSNRALSVVLRSTGDNVCFREELMTLAQRVLASVDDNWCTLPYEKSNPCKEREAQATQAPRRTAPGGILPSRLDWLCQPEQIEHTLHLLSHLNHWAKARHRYLYADRQGLYKVKAAVLQQVYTVGTITPTTYIDGTRAFANEYSFALAADIASEIFIERLANLLANEHPCVCEDGEDKLDLAARKLFTKITGSEATTTADLQKLNEQQVKTYICERLQDIVNWARISRQPIETDEFKALFVWPMDLLNMMGSRGRSWPQWDELDEAEVRKLDPEGLSLIAFHYSSSNAEYIFHLPFRVAEAFLPAQLISALRSNPGSSRESGIFFGRTISEAESQEHPIKEILRELEVDIAAICPHGLIEKEDYILQRASHHTYLCYDDDDWDDEKDDWNDDDDWDDEELEAHPKHKPKHKDKMHSQKTRSEACPQCKNIIETAGLPRIEHWRRVHGDQDLTVHSATWILGRNRDAMKALAIPPDYRGPAAPSGGQGTRFWKLATLEAAARQPGILQDIEEQAEPAEESNNHKARRRGSSKG